MRCVAVAFLAAGLAAFPAPCLASRVPMLIQHPIDMEQAQRELERAVQFITYYYRAPEPMLVPPVIQTFSDAGLLADERNHPGLLAFLTRVLADNPEQAPKIVEELGFLNAPESLLLWSAVRWSGMAGGDELIAKAADAAPQEWHEAIRNLTTWAAPSLLANPPASPSHLDMLWSAFYASGDAKYVEHIILALKGQEATSEQEAVVSENAGWTLAANSFQHRRVLEIVRERLSKTPAPAHDQLADLLASVEMMMGFESAREPTLDELRAG